MRTCYSNYHPSPARTVAAGDDFGFSVDAATRINDGGGNTTVVAVGAQRASVQEAGYVAVLVDDGS